MRFLIDSDFLVALIRANDSNHDMARNIYKRIRMYTLCVSPYTIIESTTVVSYRIGQITDIKFLKEARLSTYEELKVDLSKVDEWFFKQTKKGTSYFDCYNMALMDSFKDVEGIVSFDRIYEKNGFNMIS